LQESPPGDVNLTESHIVSQLRSLSIIRSDDPEKEKKEMILAKMNNMLAELGIDCSKLNLVVGNSIVCYFVCYSEKKMQYLWHHYQSGRMKCLLENVFSVLTNDQETVVIRQLLWNFDEHCQRMQRLNWLNAFGW
jgi:hypothetical protein